MIAQLQVEGGQLIAMKVMFVGSGARLLVDHCGRPDLDANVHSPGFQAVLALAQTGRVWIKASGFDKFSREEFLSADIGDYVHAIQQVFGEDRLIWGPSCVRGTAWVLEPC